MHYLLIFAYQYRKYDSPLKKKTLNNFILLGRWQFFDDVGLTQNAELDLKLSRKGYENN